MSEENISGKEHHSLVNSKISAGSRQFEIEFVAYSNGGFVLISEGRVRRIGAISVCVKSGQGVSSTNLVPDRRGGIFSQMVGELVAERTGGIAVVSLYLKEEIDLSVTKTLLNEVRNLCDKKD